MVKSLVWASDCFFTFYFIVKEEVEVLQLFPAKHYVLDTISLLSEEEEEENNMDMEDYFFHESTGTVLHSSVVYIVVLHETAI